MKFDRKDVDRLLGRNWNFFVQPSVGLSGGIIVLWRDWVKVKVVHSSRQMVGLQLEQMGGKIWHCCCIYASKETATRRIVLQQARKIAELGGPLLVAGDFNVVMSQEEKKGGKKFSYGPAQDEFSDFIQELQLCDLGFIGNRYTWCNNKDGLARIYERLDRVFLNVDGVSEFTGATVYHLTRLGSDHCPLLIQFSKLALGCISRRTQFENAWLHRPQTRCGGNKMA
ncbi:hypothetical protein HPP92_013371 [Vanilla planifolia]|uniref:Endonuclease/exonuclease/phosphatase domain-containing protein n=1 Tax=Vanilla planifolia TaxID=51239 RepID=A0A835R1U2_VANPL|nr:hypothetical protein HPP92_013371 [Vanilla planifolia]